MQSEIPDDVMETAKAVVDRMPTHAFKGDCVADVASAIMAHAALSTDAEPVAWRGCGRDGVSDVTQRLDISEQWNADGLDVTPLYAGPVKTAPAVAVKALEWHDRHDIPLRANDLIAESVVGQFAIRPSAAGNSYRLFMPWMHYNDAKVLSTVDDAKDYAQASFEARIRSALSAQVQDVAGLSEWQGWDSSRDYWSRTKHRDEVMGAMFRGPWSMEDAATLLGFIDRTWPAAPAKQEG
jgi:hypothetical protein